MAEVAPFSAMAAIATYIPSCWQPLRREQSLPPSGLVKAIIALTPPMIIIPLASHQWIQDARKKCKPGMFAAFKA
jgi:hypothetical protein